MSFFSPISYPGKDCRLRGQDDYSATTQRHLSDLEDVAVVVNKVGPMFVLALPATGQVWLVCKLAFFSLGG